MVQFFQRARLEYDQETRDVRLSPAGEALGRLQSPAPPAPGGRYFPETGHNLGHAFGAFFDQMGGLTTLGYPITEEVRESGRVVQWFQTMRLEWWPEHAAGQQVQLGTAGQEYLDELGPAVPDAARRPAPPLPPLREWRLPPAQSGPQRRVPPLAAPILYYHQVPSGGQLRGQIQAFKAAGRTFVPLSQVVDTLRGEAVLPPGALALTFDDGWATQYANALPVLLAERVPATFFVITRYLSTFAGYMSWEQVQAIKDAGFEVECHTQNHPSLDVLQVRNEGAAEAEIWESLAVLEGRLGHSRRLFAYPNGAWNAAVLGLVARVYRGAAATGGGYLQSQERLYTLRRIKAEPSYSAESLLKQMG
jgi:peptidoglycan/xylan/chitin deacetylase (PgdA/CDA1 family)